MKSKYGDDDGQHPLSLYSSLPLCRHHSLEGKLFVRLIVVLVYALSLSHTDALSLSLSRSDALAGALSLSRGCSLSNSLSRMLFSLSRMFSLSLLRGFSRGCSLSLSRGCSLSLELPLADALVSLSNSLSRMLSHGCSRGCSLSNSLSRMLFSLSRGCSFLSLADALFSLADDPSLTSPLSLSILWFVVVFSLSRGCSFLSRGCSFLFRGCIPSLSSLYRSCGLLSYFLL
jgi:hypothetical protein